MPNSKPRSFTCEQCGDSFTSTKKNVDAKQKRLKKIMCSICIKILHDGVPVYTEGSVPDEISLSNGMTKKHRTNLTCQICHSTWETDRSSGEILFRRNGRRFICTHCQYDAKAWRTDVVSVTCTDCGDKYEIDSKSKMLKKDRHRCSHCRVMGKTVSREVRMKISQKNTGRKLSEETKKMIGIASSSPGRVARLNSYDNQKNNRRRTGKKNSQKWIAIMKQRMTGFKHSDETRAQMKVSRAAYIDANGGTLPEETRRKIGAKITQMRMDGFKPESGHIQETYMPKKPQPPSLPPRTTPYTLSSSWESVVARWLDDNDEVISWSYECLKLTLPGDTPYLVDFVFVTADMTVVVEVKPRRKITLNVHRAKDKIEALTSYCAEHGYDPLIADEEIVAEMRASLSVERRAEVEELFARIPNDPDSSAIGNVF